jgi:hypothetical protein
MKKHAHQAVLQRNAFEALADETDEQQLLSVLGRPHMPHRRLKQPPKPTMAFARMYHLPNVLQAQIADFVGQTGQMLDETRAHDRHYQVLTWKKDVHFLCITHLDQVTELMAAPSTALTHVRHVSFFLKEDASMLTHQCTLLVTLVRRIAPRLHTLEVTLGDSSHVRCMAFFDLVVRSTPMPNLKTVMITLGSTYLPQIYQSPATDDPLHGDFAAHVHEEVQNLYYMNEYSLWYMLGVSLRRLFEIAPSFSHLSIAAPSCSPSDTTFLLAACCPRRWRNLCSLRIDAQGDSFMDLCHRWSHESEHVWPKLRFYCNPHETIVCTHTFHSTFPVLAGLVIRTIDDGVITHRDAAPSMCFLWMTNVINKISWTGLYDLFPRMEIVGITSQVLHTSIQKTIPVVVVDSLKPAWPFLRSFYTNVRSVSLFARLQFPHCGAIHVSDPDEFDGEDEVIDSHRERLTRSFLVSRRLSTWSSACNQATMFASQKKKKKMEDNTLDEYHDSDLWSDSETPYSDEEDWN